MVKSSITTRSSRIWHRISAVAAVAAIGTTFAAATPAANAQPKGGGEAKGCEVYNENTGKTELVPVGSKVGLFTCGSDGEWHFGWLINAAARPPHAPASPPLVVQIRNRSAVRLAASRG